MEDTHNLESQSPTAVYRAKFQALDLWLPIQSLPMIPRAS